MGLLDYIGLILSLLECKGHLFYWYVLRKQDVHLYLIQSSLCTMTTLGNPKNCGRY